ncbi:MAG: hypothetical protein AB7O65_08695 [Candidatus Korobacteraceae bacterium]
MNPKPTEPGSARPTSSSKATQGSGQRKPWRKKTPVQVVLEQIDRLREEVNEQEQVLNESKRQLEKLEKVRIAFEES